MKKSGIVRIKVAAGMLALCLLSYSDRGAEAATMSDYSIVPPFVSQSVPPLVMFDVARDHKLYFEAYNDASDIDDDGQLETGYKHSVIYYGYFDPFKCYTHSGGSGNTDQFTPVSLSVNNKFCSTGQWSGNVLNWLTMSRIDVLRKVIYGGYRDQDSNSSTVLQRVFLPQDAHSWGKELTGRLCYNPSLTDTTLQYTNTCIDDSDCASGFSCVDKSLNLIGMAAASPPAVCTGAVTVNWDTNNNTNKTDSNTIGNILIVKYHNSTSVCGTITNTVVPPPSSCPGCPPQTITTDTIYSSYEVSPTNFLDSYYISSFNYNSSDATNNRDALPSKDHGDSLNLFAVSEFNVSSGDKGNWQFLLDSDDGSELLIDGQIVAIYDGCHPACFSGNPPDTVNASTTCASSSAPPLPVTVNLTAGWHRLLVRHAENTGQDGIKVWYKKKNATSWTIFGNTLSLRAPIINSTNKCSIQSQFFIDTGTPVSGTAKRHLFCNTTISDTGSPLLRMLKNKTNRIWEWSAKERPVCDTSLGTPDLDLTVRVGVCDSSVGIGSENCKNYSGTYKPVGLLQKYGEGDGTKVCSKTFTQTCNTDSDCGAGQGICITKAGMYFGLMTGSYTNNLSGGVLRKNFGSILDEVSTNGILQTAENVQGNIIHTLDRMKIIEYNYTNSSSGHSPYSYDNCGWIEDRPMAQGECKNWGNPLAEIMYETLRYIAGKPTTVDGQTGIGPLTEFTYAGSQDAGLNLSKPDWGSFEPGGSRYKPYDVYPSCAKPFMLLLSDVNPNFDSDQVPGSAFNPTYTEDAGTPKLDLDVSTLANTIGTQEAIDGHSWFIGDTLATGTNFICTSKDVSNLASIRGLCPMEPTKQGSYYSAAVAYYGKLLFHAKTGLPEVNTFSVALASPFPDLKIKAGSGLISLVPQGKSASGCLGVTEACANKCTLTIDSETGLTISNCSSNAFCPTNQIVNVFVEKIEYDASGNIIYANFRINYEDSEQGADYDMDAIVHYEICTPASYNMANTSCNDSSLTADQIEVKLSSDYAAGCIDQALGFIVSGSTADGPYLPVKDADVGSTSPISSLPLTWSKIFTASGSGATSQFIKHDPLWYAAKWGGFIDGNSNDMPDLTSEWAKNDGVNPDNYYMVTNPLKLEQQLDKALTDILRRTSSGTAASIVNNRGQSGANILSAIFYPQKDFGGDNQMLQWLGDLQNYWYYFDPWLYNSTIREDTVANRKLNLTEDNKIDIYFDNTQQQTLAARYYDNGQGNYAYRDTLRIDDVSSLWGGGYSLYKRTADSRYIFTTTDGVNKSLFNTANESTLRASLGVAAADSTTGPKIIQYIRGIDTPSDNTLRNRTVTFKEITSPSPSTGVGVWKLGDIVDSTPKIQSSSPMNGYHVDYLDSTYSDYVNTSNYTSNAMVYTGANDGMLHAFRIGKITPPVSGDPAGTIADLTNPGSSPPALGSEVWAYIPRNALPYLKYLSEPSYSHLYYVDNSPLLVDASISKPTGCSSDYWNCDKKTTTSSGVLDLNGTSWRSVLIGSMGLGGASRKQDSSCNSITGSLPDNLPNCVKSPLSTAGYTDLGLSSYFALDITNPASPSLMWEFAHADLGYSTVDPVIVRINGRGTDTDPNAQNQAKNGRWFIVFTSGPTGPIETNSHQFYARSDKTLKIYIVDMKTGDYWVKDTGIANSFGGSLSTNGIDIDKNYRSRADFYSTSVVYVGYVKSRTKSYSGTDFTTWTDGGILRLATHDDLNPNNWTVSTLIDGVGPVTASIDKLYDDHDTTTGAVTPLPALWLYFGAGRYYYRNASGLDSATDRMVLYGIKEPCYSVKNVSGSWVKDESKVFNPACTTTLPSPFSASSLPEDPQAISSSTLTDQSSDTPNAGLLSGKTDGWFIKLDSSNPVYGAERDITTPSARTNGLVLFTTFKPTADVCGYGGETFFWFVDHASGGPPPPGTLKGKVIIQLSTGAIIVLDLSQLYDPNRPPPHPPTPPSTGGPKSFALARGGRQLDVGAGKPPTPPPAMDTKKKPVKKIVQIQEK